MIIQDLEGKKLTWKARGVCELFDSHRGSTLHQQARKILKTKYPTSNILEEVSIPIKSRKTLFLDFYIPSLSTAIEVHGEQHFKFNPMFHKSKFDFLKQKRNDNDKQQWCEINRINLIILRFDEINQWETQL